MTDRLAPNVIHVLSSRLLHFAIPPLNCAADRRSGAFVVWTQARSKVPRDGGVGVTSNHSEPRAGWQLVGRAEELAEIERARPRV